MELGLSEVGRHLVKFPAFFTEHPEVHNLLNKSLVTVPVLSQMDQMHILTPHFFKIQFNMIHQSTHLETDWSASVFAADFVRISHPAHT